MTNVILAGQYPAHTFETLQELLKDLPVTLKAVDTPEAYEAMTDAEIMILRIFKAPEAVIARNPKLKMIMRWGAGFDSVDIETAGKRGILVTNTPGANADAVSELAVLLMLAVGRKLVCHTDCLRKGDWSKNEFINSSYTLMNKTVGILGAGNIGRKVAQRAQAFGAKTVYYDPFRLSEEREKAFHLTYMPLDELLPVCDVITLHLPLTDETKHLIDGAAIEKMKPGAIVINTARGGLVDDCALFAAVQSGKLLGAGLDGVEREPLQPDDELFTNDNIIVTPHVGGGTADIGEAIMPMLVEDIRLFLTGSEPRFVVNRQYLAQ
ncbi:MAG: 2-hydroxyacid dehydrogenase [Clostridia bacterium]|nr:2-hydroxyacid dehydrogenase [Clostridia bacterium]MBQ3650849.1 2-hydroxyacid dehydrogenase [Clostridia bacterium]MBQ6865524.1 2-hydroxyacid dehydrogenase [Clostridia bacterium]MBQ9323232.1 2-hydroxyacid dehydrogenase [Clostridia bacterium]MBR0422827.1 2-hydroxyacid dehydrogenase [Clostridia bacterium]